MPVLIPNVTLTVRVRVHPDAKDARGVPVQSTLSQTVRGPLPGAIAEQADLSWTFRLDPSLGPVRAGDVISDGARSWVLTGNPRAFLLPGYSDADYIGGTCTLDPVKTA